jgi:hypothetical protein
LLVVLATLAWVPAAAHADPAWVHDSPVGQQSAGNLPCAAATGGVFTQVLPSIDFAEAFIDRADLPRAGEVQLVRVQWFAFGGDACRRQGTTGTSIEIITPPGVELALDKRNPALCGFSVAQDASVCPVTTAPGRYGGTVLHDARSGTPRLWPLTDAVNKTRLIVPVRLTRPVASFARTAELRCNALPCPPGDSGDRVQFAVSFVPGAGATPSRPLVTTVGLLGGRGGSRLLARKPASRITRSKLRRGLLVRVRAPGRVIVAAKFQAGSHLLAQARRQARGAGIVSLRLRAGARILAALGQGSRRARLTVSVTPRGGAVRRQSVSVRVVP